jgi:adenylylsulfate kinase
MSDQQGFAIWMTGIPASGKSSITRILANALQTRDIPVVVLESDEMRKILTPEPTYTPEERDFFYRSFVMIGEMITRNNVQVIFDATAHKRSYRDLARKRIPRFLEVYIDCPVEICIARDPKGIYRKAAAGIASTVPGIQTDYEPPLKPEAAFDGRDLPDRTAGKVLEKLEQLHYI